MPENHQGESEPVLTRKRLARLKKASYFLSIVFAFILPILVFLKRLWKDTPKKPLALSFIVIGMLGWGWSWVVSSNNWWTFGEEYLLGVELVPHLPLEEVLFYPFGGLLSILFYVAVARKKTWVHPLAYWVFLVVGTAVFGGLAWLTREKEPYYLCSQLVLYNVLCSICLAPFVAKKMNLLALGSPVILLGIVGFLWDWVGFTYGWWVYNAITGIYISVVPIADFNFFFFAPTAAISIYLLFCRWLKSPPVHKDR